MFSNYNRTGEASLLVASAEIGKVNVIACHFPGETGYSFSVVQGDWTFFFNAHDFGSNRLAFQAARAWEKGDMAFFDQFNSLAIQKGHSVGFSHICPVWL